MYLSLQFTKNDDLITEGCLLLTPISENLVFYLLWRFKLVDDTREYKTDTRTSTDFCHYPSN